LGIRAISFDFWHTLFMEQPGGFAEYKENRRRLLREALCGRGEFSDSEVDHACTLEAESHYRIWRDQHRTLVTARRVEAILGHLGVTLPDGIAAGIVTQFEEGLLKRPPVLIAGAAEILEELAQRYRLGIISDVGFSPGRVLRKVIDGAGILDLFDSLVFSDEAGRSKPHVELFERTARALQTLPGEIVHIGDLEHTDIVGAKGAGYYAIRFTGATPMEEDETTIADRVTSDLRELPRLIGAL
jgi:FMN phosphatase YigB (HAD superfamily)